MEARRGSESRRWLRARSISDLEDNCFVILGPREGLTAATVVAEMGCFEEIFRILRGRNGILEEEEGFSETSMEMLVTVRESGFMAVGVFPKEMATDEVVDFFFSGG